jgi:hypothetical protein
VAAFVASILQWLPSIRHEFHHIFLYELVVLVVGVTVVVEVEPDPRLIRAVDGTISSELLVEAPMVKIGIWDKDIVGMLNGKAIWKSTRE